MTVAFWRKWHRWIAFPAAIFLFWAAATGVSVAFTEFFGAEEALRDATADKPLRYRLHGGEAFGDGGLVNAT